MHSTRIHTHFPYEFPRRIVSECESMIHLVAKFLYLFLSIRKIGVRTLALHIKTENLSIFVLHRIAHWQKFLIYAVLRGPKSTLLAAAR